MLKEIWKTIPNQPNYQISNYGRVKSLGRYVKHSQSGLKIVREKILKTYLMKTGYVLVTFGNRKVRLVHRLVGICFLPNPQNKPCVNHLDGNPKNNIVSNLGWCTYSENERWSYDKLGKQIWNKGTKGLIKPNSGSFTSESTSGEKHWNWQGGISRR